MRSSHINEQLVAGWMICIYWALSMKPPLNEVFDLDNEFTADKVLDEDTCIAKEEEEGDEDEDVDVDFALVAFDATQP